ncbi:MAG: sulfur carrier protein ThiS [Prevotella sp.]|jgi:sulfur carrier protein|nr:sulfur carrier protein ThiS [Prevotella sp.]
MNVQINNQDHQTEARNLQDLAIELQLPQKGVAVAIDNQMIPRGSWAQTALQEGARIVIIKAACGG